MSEMFAVAVDAVTQESARLRVRSIHPDSGPPKATATFALMLMYEPILNCGDGEFSKHGHLPTCPLAHEMCNDNYSDTDWITHNARAFVAKTAVESDALEIWPTHPAWTEHLRLGMAWDSAAWSNGEGDSATPRAPAPLESGQVAHSDDPAAGFRVGTPKHEFYDCLTGALIPLHSSNRYVADPVLTDAESIRKAAKELIAHPVLLVWKDGLSEVQTLVNCNQDSITLYHERGGQIGCGTYALDSFRSIGRAWLKVKSQERSGSKQAKERKPSKK